MIRYGKYDKDGVTHYTTDIACDQMQMLESRLSAESQNVGYSNQREQRQCRQEPSQRQRPQHEAPPMDDFADDDIPF